MALTGIAALVLGLPPAGSGAFAGDDASSHTLIASDLIELVGLSDAQRQSLDRGEIITLGLPELEQDPRELAALLMLRVSGGLKDVAEFIHSTNTFGLAEDARIAPLDGDPGKALSEVVRLDPGSSEVERLMAVAPGDTFNLSEREIEAFQQAARRLRRAEADEARKAEALAETYRELLLARCHAYRRSGLDGIAPYRRAGGEQVDPGRELRMAADSVDLLEREYPQIHAALLQYPGRDLERLRHRFFVLRDIVQNRPAFLLSHWLMDIRDDYALLVERQYYVGHTYNSLQVGVLCLTYRGGTLVTLLNQTFTGEITGLFSGLKHSIGRQRIQDTIRPLFEEVREEFQSR